jgi:hypothetical protein
MKKTKTPMNIHTPKSQMGMGDNYGTAIKNKVGEVRRSYMDAGENVSKKLGKPPKSLA